MGGVKKILSLIYLLVLKIIMFDLFNQLNIMTILRFFVSNDITGVLKVGSCYF